MALVATHRYAVFAHVRLEWIRIEHVPEALGPAPHMSVLAALDGTAQVTEYSRVSSDSVVTSTAVSSSCTRSPRSVATTYTTSSLPWYSPGVPVCGWPARPKTSA